jgi:hypothetical protein
MMVTGEPTSLIWTLIGIVFVLLLVLAFAASKLWSLSRELQKLNQTLTKLDSRLTEQERQLAEVRAALASRGGDGLLEPFVEAFKMFRSKGWVSAVAMLGSHVFRSYLAKRRQRALPAKDSPDKEQQ